MDASKEALFFSFKRLIHVLATGKNTARDYGGVSLYKAEVHLLEIIGKKPGITVSDISNALEVTKGAISQIVAKLLNKQLVEKILHPGNMRIHELHLTPQGTAIFIQHELHEQGLIESILAELESCNAQEVMKFASIVNIVADFVGK